MSAQATLPPVVRSVTVAVGAERAFEVFTRRIGDWWPFQGHSCFEDDATSVAFEGDRIVERSRSGEEAVWGELVAWEPPSRVAFTWHPGYAEGEPVTEVEVRFLARGGVTVVELEHRGWERLGERAAEARASYHAGWEVVLSRFATGAAASAGAE
jgi:uncharacterized protein YndB with AHSA1/START domain